MTRDQFVNECRTWIGTPFRRQGRDRRTGVDCFGMIVLSVNTCTGKDYDSEEYRHQITLTAEMQQRLRSVCKSNPDEIRSGDILLMTLHGNPHLAVATENGIIDVQARAGVAERALPVHAEIVEALIPPELEE